MLEKSTGSVVQVSVFSHIPTKLVKYNKYVIRQLYFIHVLYARSQAQISPCTLLDISRPVLAMVLAMGLQLRLSLLPERPPRYPLPGLLMTSLPCVTLRYELSQYGLHLCRSEHVKHDMICFHSDTSILFTWMNIICCCLSLRTALAGSWYCSLREQSGLWMPHLSVAPSSKY